MQSSTSSALRFSRRKPIAACAAALFALATPLALCSTRVVTTCADSFPAPVGSLREAVTQAQNNDIVDLSTLPTMHSCSVITLNAGEIAVSQQSLTVKGSASGVTINGKPSFSLDGSRIFNHAGYGLLQMQYLTITNGNIYSATHSENGGCIVSKGNISLFHTTVDGCSANANNAQVAGGAISANGYVTMVDSRVTGNLAGNAASSQAYGGGIDATNVYALNSTISDNLAGSSGIGLGGGIHVRGFVQLFSSTVSGNRAGENFGGVYVQNIHVSHLVVVHNSTISGNVAIAGIVGGLYSNLPVAVSNSTIAFNTAALGKRSYYHYDAPGLDVVSVQGGAVYANVQSSILSNNTYQGLPNDFSEYNISGSTITASGSNNLIGTTTVTGNLGTIAGRCPLLGKLRDNGGPTMTHALLSGSSAIDEGVNVKDSSTGQLSPYDQRGAPFARVDHIQIDIGAYEVQQGDILFNTSFEGCL